MKHNKLWTNKLLSFTCALGAGIAIMSLVACVSTETTSTPLTQVSPTSAVLPASPIPATVATPTAFKSQNTPTAGDTPTSGYSQMMSSDPTIAATQKVIQKADQEQQDAFNTQNPTLMQDTATTAYYNQLVQINSQMAQGGVASIKLVQIEWGPVSLTNPTTAQANTFETWQTTYTDGSSDQTRILNVYTLVQQQGNWLIQAESLFRVIAERSEPAALILTTNPPFSECTQVIPTARLCKALLDRITDPAYIIETGSESYRFRCTMRTIERRMTKG